MQPFLRQAPQSVTCGERGAALRGGGSAAGGRPAGAGALAGVTATGGRMRSCIVVGTATADTLIVPAKKLAVMGKEPPLGLLYDALPGNVRLTV